MTPKEENKEYLITWESLHSGISWDSGKRVICAENAEDAVSKIQDIIYKENTMNEVVLVSDIKRI